jgi:hypothetical protein
MTSLPQTRQRNFLAQDGRRRTTPATATPEGSAPARVRQTLPAVDPSNAFGCVDWFLYPDQSAAEALVA